MNAALQDALLDLLVRRMDSATSGASLVDWATQALTEDIDTEALVYLAGLPGDCSVFEASPLLDRALADLGVAVPEPPQLRRGYVGAVSRALLAGTIDAEAALERIHARAVAPSVTPLTWPRGAMSGRVWIRATTAASRTATWNRQPVESPPTGPPINRWLTDKTDIPAAVVPDPPHAAVRPRGAARAVAGRSRSTPFGAGSPRNHRHDSLLSTAVLELHRNGGENCTLRRWGRASERRGLRTSPAASGRGWA
jgi:hypothetical protein